MKTGCLIKALIGSTIFFAVVFYIATNKLDDYVVNPIKNFSVKYVTKDLKEKFHYVKETPEKVTYDSVIRTREGDLVGSFFIGRNSPLSTVSPYVKSPENDYKKVLELLKNPETKDLSEINYAYREIGGRAHVGFWINCPIDWWASLRTVQTMIMDLMDYPDLLGKIFQVYTEYMVSMVDYILSNTPLDSVGIGGSTTSMSVINPELYRKHTLEFGKSVCKISHKHSIPVQYHMCGRSRQALLITLEMGVDGFDALESPPTGNVDLAEVKRVFGKQVSLRGNVNSITVMLQGKPADVERDVIRCMDAAKEGGGFILGVGDQTPYDTPEENLIAFVEAGRKYGRYSGNV